MTDAYNLHEKSRLDLYPKLFGHPGEVVDDPDLSTHEKRALLASWASDANAVPHVPSPRQLPDGSIVRVDEILRALKALDRGADAAPGQATPLWQRPFGRRRGLALRPWARYGRKPDDDDDPPPCPACAAIPPKRGGGAAFAFPETAAA